MTPAKASRSTPDLNKRKRIWPPVNGKYISLGMNRTGKGCSMTTEWTGMSVNRNSAFEFFETVLDKNHFRRLDGCGVLRLDHQESLSVRSHIVAANVCSIAKWRWASLPADPI